MAASVAPGTNPDKIVIIGAGMGGIAMEAQLKRLLNHDDFEIYKKLDIGGTWAHNKYPNLSCDVPSEVGRLHGDALHISNLVQFYSFSFFQNSEWSEKFASQREILDHIHACARHFRLEPHISLQQECVSIRWSERDGLWTCLFRDLVHDKTYEVKARYVVTAIGVLNIPNSVGDLPVLKNFGG